MTMLFSKSNLMTGIAFAALFGVVIATLRLATGGYGGPSSIPECNSNTTRDMLQDAFKNAPQAALGLKLLKIGDMSVVGKDLLDENNEIRHRVCVADVFTNIGRKPVYFNMSFADVEKKQVYLEAPMLPF
ncbi:MAG: hypothetical protein NVV83_01470 [Afipia sp.]|nr:hypothetical protein [Afipia sp.]